MKKLLALMLAAALALSLVACGGGGGSGDNNTPSTPSGGNGDATSTDTPSGGEEDSTTSMTKEEMETNAVAVSDIEAFTETILSRTEYQDDVFQHYDYMEIYAIQTKYAENPLVFVNEFANKPYYITGYVRNITSERFTLKIEDGNIANGDAQIYVYPAEQDELLTIKQGDLVTVLGIIVEREGENDNNKKYNYICIESAYIA